MEAEASTVGNCVVRRLSIFVCSSYRSSRGAWAYHSRFAPLEETQTRVTPLPVLAWASLLRTHPQCLVSPVGLMKGLGRGREPSELEVAQVMEKVDANRDGIITWEEFKTAMLEWFGSGQKRGRGDEPGSPVVSAGSDVRIMQHDSPRLSHMCMCASRRCTVIVRDGWAEYVQSRKRIHREISSFFTRFRPRDNFEEIRRKILVGGVLMDGCIGGGGSTVGVARLHTTPLCTCTFCGLSSLGCSGIRLPATRRF